MREAQSGGRRGIGMIGPDLIASLEQCLWPRGFRRDVWMIVDSARNERIYGLLLECFYSSHSCLFAGHLMPELKVAAPYLIPLEYDDQKTRKFLRCAWTNQWGVLVKCDLNRDSLRRHLRSLLSVRDPLGRRLLFRYYDPRVLRVYLPTCTSEELERMFGPIECLWTEGKSPESMLEFRPARGKLLQRTFSLNASAQKRRMDGDFPEAGEFRPELRFQPGEQVIRPAQMAAFSQAEVQKFEQWMCDHLRQFFAKQCEALSQAQLLELIQYGMKRAAAHKITSERDVCKFIDLMVVFGREFDTDKRLAWAGTILANRRTAAGKMRALYKAAAAHMGRQN